jgi:hypothetical protein
MLVNVAIPGAWSSIVLGGLPVQYRYGIPVPVGIFVHPGYLGTTLALIGIGAATFSMAVSHSWRPMAVLLLCSVGALSTLRRKVLVAFLAGAAVSTVLHARARAAIPLGVAFVVGVAATWRSLLEILVFTGDEYLTNPDRVARVRLTLDAPRLAAEYFPLGAGFGRFGSAVARANYSPEYLRLGYLNVWGLGDDAEDGKFLTDTFWPAVIGETGFFGLITYLSLLIAMGRLFIICWRSGEAMMKWLGLMGIGWSVELLIESVAGPIFMAAPSYGLLFGLAGMAVALAGPATGDSSVTTEKHEVGRSHIRGAKHG